MQNTVNDVSEKFDNDRLRNDRALVLWKSDNNNSEKKHNNNNVGSAWRPVSGSKYKVRFARAEQLCCQMTFCTVPLLSVHAQRRSQKYVLGV